MKTRKQVALLLAFLQLPLRQRIGIFTLLLLVLLSHSVHLVWQQASPAGVPRFAPELQAGVASFHRHLANNQHERQQRQSQQQETELLARYDSLSLFAFDPNLADSSTLLLLGLSEKQIRSLLNYRRKGGKFPTQASFAKLYGLPPAQFALLQPYLQLPAGTNPLPDERSKLAGAPDDAKNTRTSTSTKPEIALFPFDPNSISTAQWQQLGFSPKQAEAIVRARDKGFVFRQKEDLRKLYVVDQAKYDQLEPWIQLPDPKAATADSNRPAIVELNAATHEQLVALPGIGEITARQLLRYRDRLGGYVSLAQLNELEGLKTELLEKIRPLLRVDANLAKGIPINSIKAGDLRYHPYVGYNSASAIVKRRESYGYFKNPEQLLQEGLVDERQMEQLRPYIRLK